INHWLPSQRSTNGASSLEPTAKHALLVGQETARLQVEVPTGVGIASVDHLLPSHRSATGTPSGLGSWRVSCSAPRAVHALAAEPDTEDRAMNGPDGAPAVEADRRRLALQPAPPPSTSPIAAHATATNANARTTEPPRALIAPLTLTPREI